jgi:hypothetical protein
MKTVESSAINRKSPCPLKQISEKKIEYRAKHIELRIQQVKKSKP